MEMKRWVYHTIFFNVFNHFWSLFCFLKQNPESGSGVQISVLPCNNTPGSSNLQLNFLTRVSPGIILFFTLTRFLQQTQANDMRCSFPTKLFLKHQGNSFWSQHLDVIYIRGRKSPTSDVRLFLVSLWFSPCYRRFWRLWIDPEWILWWMFRG